MPNSALLAAVALDLKRAIVDPRTLKFHRSRREPEGPELEALNARRVELARSWVEKPIHDIYVRDGDFAVADGNERLAGLLLLGVEQITVALLPADTPDSELDDFSLLTDFHKTALKPFERAAVAKRRLDATGMKKGDLALKLRIDQGHLTKLLSLFDCIPEVIAAAERGEIGVSDWYSISRSPDQLESLRLKLGGATRDQLAAAVKRGRQDDTAAERHDRLPVPVIGGRVTVQAAKGDEPLTLAGFRALLIEAIAKIDDASRRGFGVKTAQKTFADTRDKPARKKRVKAIPEA